MMILIITEENEMLTLETFRGAKISKEDGKYKLSLSATPSGSRTLATIEKH